MSRVLIRADGDSGAEAGLGHVFRSLAYVRALMEAAPGVEPCFLMRDFPEGIERVGREGHPILKLPARPSAEDYRAALAAFEPELAIIDTLGSTQELIDACRAHARTIITLDDLTPSAAGADVVVNGILWATRLLPESPRGPRIYQGVEYLQLRGQFAEANRVARVLSPDVREMVISTGGADGRGFAAELARAASRVSFPCHVNVMIGPAYKDLSALRAIAASRGKVRFTLVENASNMAGYLMNAGLALFTAGTVMFESAACGTPAVIVSSYENQAPQAEWFRERGVFVHLGYAAEHIDCERTVAALEELARDLPRRQEMSRLGKESVDGRGLERFVNIVRAALAGGKNEHAV